MSDTYTPTTEEVGEHYFRSRWFDDPRFRYSQKATTEFQSWLAAHDAEIAAKALEDTANAWTQGGWANDMPPRGSSRSQIILGVSNAAGGFLRARAAEYRKAVGS